MQKNITLGNIHEAWVEAKPLPWRAAYRIIGEVIVAVDILDSDGAPIGQTYTVAMHGRSAHKIATRHAQRHGIPAARVHWG
jgi:argininosuccinate lyase